MLDPLSSAELSRKKEGKKGKEEAPPYNLPRSGQVGPQIVFFSDNRDVSRSGRCPNAIVHKKREDSDLLRSLNLDKKLS